MSSFQTQFPKERVFVVSLKQRKDRQAHIEKELAKKGIEFTWHLVDKHPKSGTIGCLESHVDLIQRAKDNGWNSIFIFEDDCLWTDASKELSDFPSPPENWDMMYYGGAVNEILEDYNQDWKRVSTWYTHAYAIRETMFDRIIHLADIYKGKKSIDTIYCDSIHPNYNCYMAYPILATQMEDYSDIEGSELNRDVKIEDFDLTIKKMNPNPKWAYRTYLLGGKSVNTMTYYYDYRLKVGILEEYDIEKVEMLMKGNIERGVEYSVFVRADNDEDIGFYMAKIHSPEIQFKPNENNGIFFYSVPGDKTGLFEKNGIYIINNKSYLVCGNKTVEQGISVYDTVDDLFKNAKTISDDELPKISVITPSLGRKNLFRMAQQNWINFDYPADKMEWVIINEGDESYLSMVKGDKRIKYVHIYPEQVKDIYNQYCAKLVPAVARGEKIKEKHLKYKLEKKLEKVHLDGHFYKNRIPIGMKRNMGIQAASNDIIIFMDDDDYYPPESLKTRVMDLIWSKEECVVCTDIACFDVQYQVSFLNSPPSNLALNERVSEASMCFYKRFWDEKKFNHQDIGGEGENFLKGRCDKVKVIPWLHVLVALHHRENTANRDTKVKDSNGWHFGEITDEVAALIKSIDQRQVKELRG